MTDRATETQLAQARQILGSGLFTDAERRGWLLELQAMSRFTARDGLLLLAREYTQRKRAAA